MKNFADAMLRNESLEPYRSINFTGMPIGNALSYCTMVDYVGQYINADLECSAHYFDDLVRSLIVIYAALGKSTRENTLTLETFIKLAEMIVKKNIKK